MDSKQIRASLFWFQKHLYTGPLLLLLVSVWVILWGHPSFLVPLALGLGCGLSVSVHSALDKLVQSVSTIKADLPYVIRLVQHASGDIQFVDNAPVIYVSAIRLCELCQRKAALLVSITLATQTVMALFLLFAGFVANGRWTRICTVLLVLVYLLDLLVLMRRVLASTYIPPLKRKGSG